MTVVSKYKSRFWVWMATVALMPVAMIVFSGFVFLDAGAFADLFSVRNAELFLIWESAYMIGGLIAYPMIKDIGWLPCAFLSWIVVCPFILVFSFMWATGIREGFKGLAYIMTSCIAWGASIIPLLPFVWLYKKTYAERISV